MLDDHSCTLELTYSSTYSQEPIAAPRYGLPSRVTFTPDPANVLEASSRCLCFGTSQVLAGLGKYPKAGSSAANLFNHA